MTTMSIPCSVFLPSSKKCAVKISSKTVTIEIPDANCYQGDEWGRLDEVLTTPGWFSLKRVSLTIEFASFSRSDDDDELLEVASRKLLETRFPRLSATTSVSFDFEVIRVVV